MRIARFWLNDEARYGVVDGPELRVLDGHPLVNGYEYTGDRVAMKDVKLLAPTVPSKIVCIGKNYAAHAEEIGEEVPDEPLIFLKPNTTLVGSGEAIVLPAISERVDHEVELAIVIGDIARKVPAAEAQKYIWGYTIGNDVTARDLQAKDGQWTRSKGFDTFTHVEPEDFFDDEDWALDRGTRRRRADGRSMVTGY